MRLPSHLLLILSLLISATSMTTTTTKANRPPPRTSPTIAQLADRALNLAAAAAATDGRKREGLRRQVFIGIAGGPGSGKTTLSELVCDEINLRNKKKGSGDDVAVVVPTDGYHIPKATLKEMAERGFSNPDDDDDATTGEALSYKKIMARRGAPWTFDSKALCDDLKAAKARGEGQFPIYDRTISDPVPDGVRLTTRHRIVLCEGLYVLALDTDEYGPLGEVLDERWFVDVPEEVLRERIVGRSLKTWSDQKRRLFGEGREGALRKFETNDLKNVRWIVRHSRNHADLLIQND